MWIFPLILTFKNKHSIPLRVDPEINFICWNQSCYRQLNVVVNSFLIHWNTANACIRKYNQSILILFPETLLLYKKDYSISYIPNKALSTKESTNRSKSMKLCIHAQEKTATLSLTAMDFK